MLKRQKERRIFPRVSLKSPLRYQVRGGSCFGNAVGEDISVGGMAFQDARFIAPQTPLALEINVLSRILRPTGKVVWVNPIAHSDKNRLGIEFLEFAPQEKRYLADYISMRKET